jgi:hypothetical protein
LAHAIYSDFLGFRAARDLLRRAAMRTALLFFSLVFFACSHDETSPPTPAAVDASKVAVIVSAVTSSDSDGLSFLIPETNTPPSDVIGSTCASASITSGACCYFPSLPVATQPASARPAPRQRSAGRATITNLTATAPLGTFDYHAAGYLFSTAGITGSGQLPNDAWHPGDTLRVEATGGADIGPFAASAIAVLPPVIVLPPAIAREADLATQWAPDPNAAAFTLELSDGDNDIVLCSVPDAAGSVRVNGALLAKLSKSADLDVRTYRYAVHFEQTPWGRIEFDTTSVRRTSLPMD